MEVDPSCQGFGTLAKQFGRGAAQHEETGRQGLAVGQHTQDGKEPGGPLHFVDDDKPLEPPERQHGIGQATQIGGIFQVQVRATRGEGRDETAGQGGIADLACRECHHRIPADLAREGGFMFGSSYQYPAYLEI
jgi:hypothetical protein